MSEVNEKPTRDITVSGGGTIVTRPSGLVRRGLDALIAEEPRVLRFPESGFGTLFVRNRGTSDEVQWEGFIFRDPQGYIIRPHGTFSVPLGKELKLRVPFYDGPDFLFLTSLRADDLHTLEFINLEPGDARIALQSIRHLSSLRVLSAMNNDICDADVVYLESLTGLRSLDLSRTAITNKGFLTFGNCPRSKNS